MLDGQISGIRMSSMEQGASLVSSLRSRKGMQDARKEFIKDRINALDMQFGRTLGCRMSNILKLHVEQDNHIKRNEIGWVKFQGRWMLRTKPKKERKVRPAEEGEQEGEQVMLEDA